MFDYTKSVTKTVSEIKPSGIRKFFDIIDVMKDVTSLTIGQPDFTTPWHIREAGIESLEKGKTYYTSNSGLVEFREAVAEYLKRRFDLSYEPTNEIMITVGGSEAIDLAIRSLVAPGDEVIIVAPSYVCYEPITRLTGGVPVIINTKIENKFKLTPEELRAAISDKSKLLILPYPNNPTGGIMTREELEKIAEVLRDTNIAVLTDEIYGELTYGRKHFSFAALPGMKERTIFISGFSKSYAMTGWRLGYVCAPKEFLSQMFKIHQYAIMCAPTTSQYAGIKAMRDGDSDIEYMRDEYNRRRKLILLGLREIGFECFEPEGAFYVFPSVKKYGLSSDEFCEKLLYEEHTAIVPGNAFGESGEGFARISYAYSVAHINKALDKLDGFVKKLK